MARKYRKYPYEPMNPEKFSGPIPIIFRSSWELEFGEHCDKLPSVLSWGYESVAIPYKDPITGKQKTYTPDFFVEIAQQGGFSKHFIFEIKPMKEQLDEHARSRADAALIARNNAKWAAATRWGDRHSMEFQVLNENNLFGGYEHAKGRANPIKTFAHTHSTTPASKPTSKRTKAPNIRVKQVNKNASKMQSRISKAKKARSNRTRRTPKI